MEAIDSSRVKRWLREPLFHFHVIGLALFIAYSLIAPKAPQASSNRIELTSDDLNQLQMSWAAQWQRPPTPDEMRGLIDERVRQEILFREGIALGLDQGDEIIKRRMAQKMEFLAEDVSTVSAPTSADLRAWFDKNSSRFSLPGLITFRHLYFSPDARGQKASGRCGTSAWKALGEFGGHIRVRRPVHVPGLLCGQFAGTGGKGVWVPVRRIDLQTETGVWQGPIESGLGWHLVRIEAMTPGRVPAFEEVDSSQIKSEWMSDQRAESKRQSFEVMKKTVRGRPAGGK